MKVAKAHEDRHKGRSVRACVVPGTSTPHAISDAHCVGVGQPSTGECVLERSLLGVARRTFGVDDELGCTSAPARAVGWIRRLLDLMKHATSALD